MIRGLCKELEASAAIPSVLAGVMSVLTLPSPVTRETFADKELQGLKTPALIVAVFFFVRTRLLGKEVDGKTYSAEKKRLLGMLEVLRDNEELSETMKAKLGRKSQAVEDGQVWKGWEKVKSRDVDMWLKDINEKGWLSLDWYQNVVEGAGLAEDNGIADESDDMQVDQEDDEEEEKPDKQANGLENVLQAGLGTMMQDRVDYLSDKNREKYKVWRGGILIRIEKKSREVNAAKVRS